MMRPVAECMQIGGMSCQTAFRQKKCGGCYTCLSAGLRLMCLPAFLDTLAITPRRQQLPRPRHAWVVWAIATRYGVVHCSIGLTGLRDWVGEDAEGVWVCSRLCCKRIVPRSSGPNVMRCCRFFIGREVVIIDKLPYEINSLFYIYQRRNIKLL
jgi:hypothetical protein